MTDPFTNPDPTQPDQPFNPGAEIYRAPNVPQDVTPSDALFNELKASKPASAPAVATTPTTANPNTSLTAQPNAGLLDRLKPYGVTDLARVNAMADQELRDLSKRVVIGEERQKALSQYFRKNPDGSYDFSLDPSGAPTGLDATGKVPPPVTPTAPAKPPEKPAPPAKPSAPRPAAKKPAVSGKAAELIAIRRRAEAKGLHPTEAQVLGTWRRNQTRKSGGRAPVIRAKTRRSSPSAPSTKPKTVVRVARPTSTSHGK